MFHLIVDRRKKGKGESIVNKKRFLDRIEKKIKESSSSTTKGRKISDQGGGEYTISTDGIEEPQFTYDTKTGDWDIILPGNKEYKPGDRIKKPTGGSGGRGNEGSPDGEGKDDFRFYLDLDTQKRLIFDGLELPEMVKQSMNQIANFEYKRAGYTVDGAASNMNIIQTSIKGLSRRIALRTPKLVKIAELEKELENETDEQRRLELEEQIKLLREAAKRIPFLDNVDRRYNNFVKVPKPKTTAVMIMIMDVSGSMTEEHKFMAKRFFVLLYLFLQEFYKEIEVVFIRHTHEASEVDERTFFEDQETGGTVVSTSYVEALKIIKERYNPDETNIYVSQASDGDNTTSDNEESSKLLGQILDLVQYFWYVEVQVESGYYSSSSTRQSDVWQIMEATKQTHKNMDFRKIKNPKEVTPVFQDLFKKKEKVSP